MDAQGEGFRVRPAHLYNYSGQIGGAGHDADAIAHYCEQYCGDTSGFDGILAVVESSTRATADRHADLLKDVGAKLHSTAGGLQETADRYRAADEGAREKIEQAAQAPPRTPSVVLEDENPGYNDVAEPRSRLTAPSKPTGGIDAKVEQISGLLGLVDDIYRFITGDSLVEKIVKPVSGDWGRLLAIAESWENVGNAVTDVHDNLQQGAHTIGPYWQGTAAAGFQYYMRDRWLLGLMGEAEAAEEAATAVKTAARGAAAAFNLLVQTSEKIADELLSTKIDKLLKGLVKKVLWPWLLWSLYRLVDKAVKHVNEIKSTIDDLQLMMEMMSTLKSPDGDRYQIHRLPMRPYDSPEEPGYVGPRPRILGEPF